MFVNHQWLSICANDDDDDDDDYDDNNDDDDGDDRNNNKRTSISKPTRATYWKPDILLVHMQKFEASVVDVTIRAD